MSKGPLTFAVILLLTAKSTKNTVFFRPKTGYYFEPEPRSLKTAGHSLKTAGHSLKTAGHILKNTGHSLKTAGHILKTAGHILKNTGQDFQIPA
jgi:hypothetical protein